MKRLIICSVLILAASSAFAQGVPAPSTPRLMVDSTGKLVDSTNPLPVEVTGGLSVTIGSATISFQPVYSDDGGSGTLGLVDSDRRVEVNVSSHTTPLPTGTNVLGQTYDAPLATPTVTDMTCWATPQVIMGPASRVYIIWQNKAATESAYTYPGSTATPGRGIEIQAGDSVLQPCGSQVKWAVVSTDPIDLTVIHGVMP